MEFISQIATKVHQFSFTSHVLTQIQVYESQKEGLIPSNIDVLLDRIIMSYPSSDSTFGSGGNLSPRFLESIGIKESFFTLIVKVVVSKSFSFYCSVFLLLGRFYHDQNKL